MKEFDPQYELLADMYGDGYFPTFLVDKIKSRLEDLIAYLAQGGRPSEEIQQKLDELTADINDLQAEFYENDSEIETVARDAIAASVKHILAWFDIAIDIETALRGRDW